MSASPATPKLAASPASPLTARIAAEFAAADASGGPLRQRALAALVASGLPTSRDENWEVCESAAAGEGAVRPTLL